jgi:hypothetical protein
MGVQDDDVAAFKFLMAEVTKEFIALASLQGRSCSAPHIASTRSVRCWSDNRTYRVTWREQ